MNTILKFGSVAIALSVLSGCDLIDALRTAFNGEDAITLAEANNMEIACPTTAPYGSVTFNDNNTGTTKYVFPNNTPPSFEGTITLNRVGTIPNKTGSVTTFEMSNGMRGTLTDFGGGQCEDGHFLVDNADYMAEFTSWNGSTLSIPHKACCVIQAP